MSPINATDRAEILGGLRNTGADVRERALTVPEHQLRARVDADQADPNARRWLHDHVDQAVTAFATLLDTDERFAHLLVRTAFSKVGHAAIP